MISRYAIGTASIVVVLAALLGAANAAPRKGHMPEIFRTQTWDEDKDDVDSAAVWRNPQGGGMLFLTAKAADKVYVCDALSGKLLRTIGGPSDVDVKMKYPNGVAVFDDYLLIVERDGKKVSVFSLPDMEPAGEFGGDVLIKPYGITGYKKDGAWEVFVTDDFDWPLKEKGKPAKRVKHFRMPEGKAEAKLVNMFGEPQGGHALLEVETIMIDPDREVLWICDEKQKAIREFTTDGHPTGKTVGAGIIDNDPEGLALCVDPKAPSGGWWMLSDQGDKETILRIFDRTGTYVGLVTAQPNLANTDGICFSQGDLGDKFQGGALYCIHDDCRTHAYSWADIAKALGL